MFIPLLRDTTVWLQTSSRSYLLSFVKVESGPIFRVSRKRPSPRNSGRSSGIRFRKRRRNPKRCGHRFRRKRRKQESMVMVNNPSLWRTTTGRIPRRRLYPRNTKSVVDVVDVGSRGHHPDSKEG